MPLAPPPTKPFIPFWGDLGVSNSKGYDIVRQGEVDTVMVAGRRHVVIASWEAYIERQRLGIDRAPEERQRAIEYYERTSRASIAKFWGGSKPSAEAAHAARARRFAEKTAIVGGTTSPPKADLFEENSPSNQ